MAGSRFLIEDVYPTVDAGRFPVKRIAGEPLEVWADIFRDGHEVSAASLLWCREGEQDWRREPMRHFDNDRWTGSFTPAVPGRYLFAIEAWTDDYATWRRDLLLKRQADQPIELELQEGRALLERARHGGPTARAVIKVARESGDFEALLSDELAAAMAESQPRPDLSWSRTFPLTVDRERARAGAWYELFPRSQGRMPGRHGTFDDCIARLPDIAALGFDVVYLPPIHPIGRINRKGRNNALSAGPDDPGSPYAIGAAEGGHDAIHPELGTLDDFRRLVAACRTHGMEVALDFATQCSPDHPWLQATSRLVQAATRRLDQICRESAEEISGHPQSGFLLRRPCRALDRVSRCRPVLGRPGRAHLPRRQPAHQTVRILAMADPATSRAAIPA